MVCGGRSRSTHTKHISPVQPDEDGEAETAAERRCCVGGPESQTQICDDNGREMDDVNVRAVCLPMFLRRMDIGYHPDSTVLKPHDPLVRTFLNPHQQRAAKESE